MSLYYYYQHNIEKFESPEYIADRFIENGSYESKLAGLYTPEAIKEIKAQRLAFTKREAEQIRKTALNKAKEIRKSALKYCYDKLASFHDRLTMMKGSHHVLSAKNWQLLQKGISHAKAQIEANDTKESQRICDSFQKKWLQDYNKMTSRGFRKLRQKLKRIDKQAYLNNPTAKTARLVSKDTISNEFYKSCSRDYTNLLARQFDYYQGIPEKINRQFETEADYIADHMVTTFPVAGQKGYALMVQATSMCRKFTAKWNKYLDGL